MFTNSVFVIDQSGNRLKPCSPVRARKLQKAGKAKKFRLYPFTLILQSTVENPPEPCLTLGAIQLIAAPQLTPLIISQALTG